MKYQKLLHVCQLRTHSTQKKWGGAWCATYCVPVTVEDNVDVLVGMTVMVEEDVAVWVGMTVSVGVKVRVGTAVCVVVAVLQEVKKEVHFTLSLTTILHNF